MSAYSTANGTLPIRSEARTGTGRRPGTATVLRWEVAKLAAQARSRFLLLACLIAPPIIGGPDVTKTRLEHAIAPPSPISTSNGRKSSANPA